jgi:hypothetical protein
MQAPFAVSRACFSALHQDEVQPWRAFRRSYSSAKVMPGDDDDDDDDDDNELLF